MEAFKGLPGIRPLLRVMDDEDGKFIVHTIKEIPIDGHTYTIKVTTITIAQLSGSSGVNKRRYVKICACVTSSLPERAYDVF